MIKHNQFTHALTRQPAPNAGDGLTTSTHLGAPDVARMNAQYDAYLDALRACGLSVTTLPADTNFPDGHFVEDPAVIYGDMVFISRPGASERRGEERAIEQALSHLRQIHLEGEHATLDGGDVLMCADHVLIGISQRTNEAGAEQLANALHTVDANLRVDSVSFTGVLHLKTGITELAPNVLLHAPQMQTDYDFGFAEVVMLPEVEAYAADVLPINEHVIIPKGYPTVRELAHQHYANVIELDMSEFEKMDGGLTCLSLRY
jgi:dimethylargininase